MSQAFHPNGVRVRLLSIGTALLAAAGILLTVLGLAGHNDKEFLQVARSQAGSMTAHDQPQADPPAQVDTQTTQLSQG